MCVLACVCARGGGGGLPAVWPRALRCDFLTSVTFLAVVEVRLRDCCERPLLAALRVRVPGGSRLANCSETTVAALHGRPCAHCVRGTQADAAIVLESDLVPGADMYTYFRWMRDGLAAAPAVVRDRVFSVYVMLYNAPTR